MAKPRTVKYRNGEVILKSLSAEDADLVEVMLLTSQPRMHIWEEEFDKKKCTEYAFGLVETTEGFILSTIKYSPLKGWSFIESRENVGKEYYIATGKARALIGSKIFDKRLKV
jgi:hypothetical protein